MKILHFMNLRCSVKMGSDGMETDVMSNRWFQNMESRLYGWMICPIDIDLSVNHVYENRVAIECSFL